jgi:hypothetical protein
MRSLVKALVDLAAFLELSEDGVIDPDEAVRALESMTHCLQNASEEEKRAVLDYCQEQASAETGRRREFFQGFGAAVGLTPHVKAGEQ